MSLGLRFSDFLALCLLLLLQILTGFLHFLYKINHP